MTAYIPKIDLEMTDAVVETHVEHICQQGCRHVYSTIDHIEAGELPGELAGLNRTQRAQLIEELRAIMAVYAENGSVCLFGSR